MENVAQGEKGGKSQLRLLSRSFLTTSQNVDRAA
jgi:hypothetical protein